MIKSTIAILCHHRCHEHCHYHHHRHTHPNRHHFHHHHYHSHHYHHLNEHHHHNLAIYISQTTERSVFNFLKPRLLASALIATIKQREVQPYYTISILSHNCQLNPCFRFYTFLNATDCMSPILFSL